MLHLIWCICIRCLNVNVSVLYCRSPAAVTSPLVLSGSVLYYSWDHGKSFFTLGGRKIPDSAVTMKQWWLKVLYSKLRWCIQFLYKHLTTTWNILHAFIRTWSLINVWSLSAFYYVRAWFLKIYWIYRSENDSFKQFH